VLRGRNKEHAVVLLFETCDIDIFYGTYLLGQTLTNGHKRIKVRMICLLVL
jgi:hypothetical protein